MLTGPQIIVLATPVFFLLIGIEFLVGLKRRRNTYRLNDALNSIGLGIMSQIVGGVQQAVRGRHLHAGVRRRRAVHAAGLVAVGVGSSGLLIYDLCYYWHHRLGHTGRAVLGRARGAPPERGLQPLDRAAPDLQRLDRRLAVLPADGGCSAFPPVVFATVALIDLLYQYWVHTQQIGRLGWFDRWFCAPSNHRVHHAVNDKYLDRNYGGILIVWDRLFGSFSRGDDAEPCVYGTRGRCAAGTRCGPTCTTTATWPGLLARRRLARQAARLVHAPRLAPGGRGGRAGPSSPSTSARSSLYDPPVAARPPGRRRAVSSWCSTPPPGSSGTRTR
jgi:sterol desaturase/sphingolipid hydroxylase (fatty acid hydroxylase superfamily)